MVHTTLSISAGLPYTGFQLCVCHLILFGGAGPTHSPVHSSTSSRARNPAFKRLRFRQSRSSEAQGSQAPQLARQRPRLKLSPLMYSGFLMHSPSFAQEAHSWWVSTQSSGLSFTACRRRGEDCRVRECCSSCPWPSRYKAYGSPCNVPDDLLQFAGASRANMAAPGAADHGGSACMWRPQMLHSAAATRLHMQRTTCRSSTSWQAGTCSAM